MPKLSHPVSRTFFCLLLLALGIATVGDGLATALYSRAVSGLAIILIGVHSFLVPVVLGAPLREMRNAAQAHAIGSPRLRRALVMMAMVLLFAGLFMRWGLNV